NLSVFVGVNGPPTNAGAAGVSLTGVDFGLALMNRKRPTPPTVPTDLRTWTALKASATGISVLGIDGVTLSGTNLSIAINQGGGANGGVNNSTVVDFSLPNALAVDTGADPVILNFPSSSGTLLRLSGTVQLGLYDFFNASGSITVVKNSATVNLSDGSTGVPVDMLTVGVASASAFVGLNGPSGSLGAVGLSLSNVD